MAEMKTIQILAVPEFKKVDKTMTVDRGKPTVKVHPFSYQFPKTYADFVAWVALQAPDSELAEKIYNRAEAGWDLGGRAGSGLRPAPKNTNTVVTIGKVKTDLITLDAGVFAKRLKAEQALAEAEGRPVRPVYLNAAEHFKTVKK